MIQSQSNTQTKEAYDKQHYESACCKQIHPDNIYYRALIKGYQPANLDEAHILEIGCGIGTDLIPFAISFPNTQCTGIDLSSSQIKRAQDSAKALNIKNISFIAEDITNKHAIEEKLQGQKYDYIYCHGVLSWVDTNTQTKILEFCEQHLSPNGFAAISYKTLPGGYLDKAVQDIMAFDARQIIEPKQKVERSRNFLDIMATNALEDTPFRKSFAQIFKNENNELASFSDSYIYHDHLNESSQAFYLQEFADRASGHNLKYVCDAAIDEPIFNGALQNYTANMSDIEREQYSDFISARRFRISILTHGLNTPSQITSNIEHENELTDKIVSVSSEQPKAFPLALYQVSENKEKSMLTNIRRESIKTTLFMNLIILYANGENTKNDILDALKAHNDNGDFTLKAGNGDIIRAENARNSALNEALERQLKVLTDAGLIIC